MYFPYIKWKLFGLNCLHIPSVKYKTPKGKEKDMRSPFKCLKSNLVLIKKEKKERSEQFYMKEHHAVVRFVFHVLEPSLTIPVSDGTDPPKKKATTCVFIKLMNTAWELENLL